MRNFLLCVLLLAAGPALAQMRIVDNGSDVIIEEGNTKKSYPKRELSTRLEGNRLQLLYGQMTIKTFASHNQVTLPVSSSLDDLEDKIMDILSSSTQATKSVSDSISSLRAAINMRLPKVDTTGRWMNRGISIPRRTSQLTNDAGFLTSEIDPTVPAYAKALTSFNVIKASTDALYATQAQAAAGATALQPGGNGSSLTGITKSQVGLGNVDNTSDLNKPISVATQAALDSKLSAEVDGSITNEIQTLSRSGNTISISGGNSITLPVGKRYESYSGTTTAAGTYTVTFSTPFATPPNIQASITNQANVHQQIRVQSVTTTGCVVHVYQRNSLLAGLLGNVEILLASTSNVSGASVDVLAVEK